MTTNAIRCLALAIGILAVVQAFAQAGDRTLSGAITSPSGSRIATARLSIKNIANGSTESETVKRDASYVVRNLLPGTYEIILYAPGFPALHKTVQDRGDCDQEENRL